jgi:glycosyltransferase involved in cell wall biosynthesis
MVIHVRSVQETSSGRLRARLVAAVLRHHADAVIAIDETVRRSLPPGIDSEVIHNSYIPGGGQRNTAPPPELPSRQPGTLRVGMVGNLLPMKGVSELMEAARICRDRQLAVDFMLVGANTRRLSGWTGKLLEAMGFARDVERDVRQYLAANGLEDRVHLVPFTPHIDQVYRGMDVLCFPSHLEAAGRPVFEAAFYGVPGIVAISDALPDTFIEGETGLRAEPHNARSLADAIERFCRQPGEIARMGAQARALAERNFDASRNARKVAAIYERVLQRRAGAP